jgi:hypothetical protein
MEPQTSTPPTTADSSTLRYSNMADNSDAALRIGKFTEAAVGIAIDVAQNTIKHNTWYKSYASLDSHIRGQLESDVNYRWPAYADISDRRTKKTIIVGVRQKLIEKDIIDFETLPTPTPQPIAITPFEERFALYTAKAEIIASYFKPEPGASFATTKLLEMQVKSFMDENYPEFHYGTLNNEERSYNAKLINTSAVQREVLRKAAELIAERSAGPVVAKPSEKADGLPFHQSPAFEIENSEQPPAREKEITGPVRHCNVRDRRRMVPEFPQQHRVQWIRRRPP